MTSEPLTETATSTEKGLLIAVLLMVLLGVGGMLLMV
jgi:hypothetical protein